MSKLQSLKDDIALELEKYTSTNCKIQKEYLWSKICKIGGLIQIEESKINDPCRKILKVDTSFNWANIPFSNDEAIKKIGCYD